MWWIVVCHCFEQQSIHYLQRLVTCLGAELLSLILKLFSNKFLDRYKDIISYLILMWSTYLLMAYFLIFPVRSWDLPMSPRFGNSDKLAQQKLCILFWRLQNRVRMATLLVFIFAKSNCINSIYLVKKFAWVPGIVDHFLEMYIWSTMWFRAWKV